MCDGLLKYRGKYYILEIKTESTFKWQNRTDVDDGHKDQATTYSMLLQVPNVIFLYENRDVCKLKAFMFNVTAEMKESLISYIEECDGYVSRQIAPPKSDSVPKKTCGYCMYKTQCRKDG